MKEAHVHIYMRSFLRSNGWRLIAGEYPGGSDHELYPLNITDPEVACDRSPDPRRHSLGELIPDLVALKGRLLLVVEAKPEFNLADQAKLDYLLSSRKGDFLHSLDKFARERAIPELLPVTSLELLPVLAFAHSTVKRIPPPGFTFLQVASRSEAYFCGALESFA